MGIWGSSFSGGYVVYVAARDPRVKAFVSQVGAMDGRWVLGREWRQFTFEQGTSRSQGKTGYPKPSQMFGQLRKAASTIVWPQETCRNSDQLFKCSVSVHKHHCCGVGYFEGFLEVLKIKGVSDGAWIGPGEAAVVDRAA